jgi:hypothetical protein
MPARPHPDRAGSRTDARLAPDRGACRTSTGLGASARIVDWTAWIPTARIAGVLTDETAQEEETSDKQGDHGKGEHNAAQAVAHHSGRVSVLSRNSTIRSSVGCRRLGTPSRWSAFDSRDPRLPTLPAAPLKLGAVRRRTASSRESPWLSSHAHHSREVTSLFAAARLHQRCSGRSMRGFQSSWPKSQSWSGPMGRPQRGQTISSPRSMRRANCTRRRRWDGPYIVRWRAFFTSRLRSRSAFTIAADFACSRGSAGDRPQSS